MFYKQKRLDDFLQLHLHKQSNWFQIGKIVLDKKCASFFLSIRVTYVKTSSRLFFTLFRPLQWRTRLENPGWGYLFIQILGRGFHFKGGGGIGYTLLCFIAFVFFRFFEHFMGVGPFYSPLPCVHLWPFPCGYTKECVKARLKNRKKFTFQLTRRRPILFLFVFWIVSYLSPNKQPAYNF